MSDWICSICLCNNRENTVKLEGCNHEFHSNCIVTCLRINGPKCPNCRGLDSRCQNSTPPYQPFDINMFDDNQNLQDEGFQDINDISNIENVFDETSDFDMEIQEMLLNIVENDNTSRDYIIEQPSGNSNELVINK